jgi:energy-coupling factor transporter transmembrane protein EcfT
MKANLKLILKATLLFAVVFFVVYLLMAIAAYFGCCVELTALFYTKMVWVILGLGVLVFAFCVYNNCYKKKGPV